MNGNVIEDELSERKHSGTVCIYLAWSSVWWRHLWTLTDLRVL